MDPNQSPQNSRGTFLREDAAEYLLISNVSFALSVALVRLFLSLTGYPKIGGGALHISHVLWGGLLLFIAVLILLVLDNYRVLHVSAILSGVGVGLFIDEVGKFITSDYNYFYPAAAPIVYIFFLVVLLVYLRVRRLHPRDDVNELIHALELLEQDLEEPLDAQHWKELGGHLTTVASRDPGDKKTHLALALSAYLEGENRPVPKRGKNRPGWQRFLSALKKWLTEGRLRALLAGGLVLMGLLSWRDPIRAAPFTPPGVAAMLSGSLLGDDIPAQNAPGLFAFSSGVDTVIGVLFLAAAVVLALRRSLYGIGLSFAALLLALILAAVPLFYFEQFSAIPLVALQFLLLVGLIAYEKWFGRALKDSPAYLWVTIQRVERWFTFPPRRFPRMR